MLEVIIILGHMNRWLCFNHIWSCESFGSMLCKMSYRNYFCLVEGKVITCFLALLIPLAYIVFFSIILYYGIFLMSLQFFYIFFRYSFEVSPSLFSWFSFSSNHPCFQSYNQSLTPFGNAMPMEKTSLTSMSQRSVFGSMFQKCLE